MKTNKKFYWCGFLLLPTAIYYLLLLLLPTQLANHTFLGIPLSILFGLLVILWAVIVTFFYTFTLLSEIKNTQDDASSNP